MEKMAVVILVVLVVLCSVVQATYPGNYALSFDGLDDYVTVPSNYNDHLLNDFWTIEAWINPAAEQQYWQLNLVGFPQRHPNINYCGQDNGQCKPGEPLAQLRDSHGNWFPVIGTAAKFPPNEWHHIAATWNNVTLSLYLDGELDISVLPYTQGYTEALSCRTAPIQSCDVGLQIGGNRFRLETGGIFSNQYFRGFIDEVRVWTAGRSQQEIQANMRKTLIGREPGLLYYWRFDDYGTQVTRSAANDIYALLGGGNKDAEPQFITSQAPLDPPPYSTTHQTTGPAPPAPTQAPVIIEKNSAGAVTAGALIGVFCLIGGLAFGLFVGVKSSGKRFFSAFWKSNDGETTGLIR